MAETRPRSRSSLHSQMRAGTQTLIQALQAIPWAEDADNEDDMLHPDVTSTEAESDEEDKTGADFRAVIIVSATTGQGCSRLNPRICV